LPRLAAIAAAATCACAWTGGALAADAPVGPAASSLLSWPGKVGPHAAAKAPAAGGPVALPKQFFGGGDDMAAAPPPLPPRAVPGSQAVTSTATENTASNRARQNDLLTADSASDGPVGGAEDPN
jgi:hypothetical protein